MQAKCVFVLLDGCRSDSAKAYLGYLEHCQQAGQAAKYEVLGELPSASRPMYETIFTGVPVYRHGITNNSICRLSDQDHLFKMLHRQNKKSLVLAYHWISELYLKAPFDPDTDMLHEDADSDIDSGFFYDQDMFPDSHLYHLAVNKMRQADYDFVLIHPMNIDYAGHLFGQTSKEYARAVLQNDVLLSTYIPKWRKQGYSVVVGADHGMSELGLHGGDAPDQRRTALYIFDDRVECGEHDKVLSTLEIAPLLCRLTGTEPASCMKSLEVRFNEPI